MSDTVVLRATRWVDINAMEVRSPAVIVVEGNRIAAVNPETPPNVAIEIDLGDVNLPRVPVNSASLRAVRTAT